MATRLFPPGAEDTLYLVDLSGYIFRAYHAIDELTSPTGEPTNAVFGTVNMLSRLVRERRPVLLAVAMDSRTETFRKRIYPEYKANRPTPPEDLIQQIGRVAEVVDAMAIPVLQQDGVEADDLIASAVDAARARGLKVVIVSADKDLTQLVGDDVLMWDTMRNKVVGPLEVEERFGVQTSQVRDLLALMGDSSDNVPGVPSVGPKTARDLLQQFATLEGVFANLDQIQRKKLRETLTTHREQAELSQRLVTLKRDCQVELDPAALRYGGRDTARLKSLYQELGFFRLLKTLDEAVDAAPPAVGEPPPTATTEPVAPEPAGSPCVLDPDQLAQIVAQARAAGHVSLGVLPCSPDRHQPAVAGLALAVAPGCAYYVPVAHRAMGAPRQLSWDAVRAAVAPLLEDATLPKAVHGLKRSLLLLRHQGVELGGVAFDVELASYLLNPEARHSLDALAEPELGMAIETLVDVTKAGRKRIDFDEVDVETATRFATTGVDVLGRLWQRLGPRLTEARLESLLADVELPLAQLLAEMEQRGVLLDVARLQAIGVNVARDLERLDREAQAAAGRGFNVNSPRQLETILFDELGLKPIKRTKTSRSTDAATLEALSGSHPLPGIVLEQRKLAKLKGTYIDALPGLVHPRTGRIHTSWEQAVTATGRLSSTEPNLQNIPIRTELGRTIRSAFIAPPGHQLVSADYSQIELRVLAHLSQDPVLLDAFQSNQDVHTRTASEIFETPLDQVSREQRSRAKAVNFGIIYGQGDSGLAKAVGISRAEASNFIAAYYRRYEGVRRFMLDETLVHARQSETVHSMLGRRRMVPDIRSGNRAKRLAAERVAMNMPIQGTAADLLKLAMLKLRDPVTPGSRMILTVHDELVFEVPDAEMEEATTRIRDAMQNVYELSVPLVVDVGHGPTWSEAH